MHQAPSDLHVYARELSQDDRSSLTVLGGMISSGARVLDLGCGSGSLGRHLVERHGCRVDGVTFNPREAELARPSYHRVEIADLDECDLLALFPGQQYDYIVCADVLEHLKHPERVLLACQSLLEASAGELLISIPHVGYAGLVADLIQGQFRYRDEGLLDRTHLKFFTRQSLLDFLGQEGWGVLCLETIERPLSDSEFSARFDELPPAVARFLLSAPDALTYQFIARARHGIQGVPVAENARPRSASFNAHVYWAVNGDYSEAHKVLARGAIGQARQTLQFALPSGMQAERLRLDPADRPGFLHLFSARLFSAQGRLLWDWAVERDGLVAFQGPRSRHLLMRGPGLGSPGAMALMYGDDPWTELPVAHVIHEAAGGRFEIELGWPMSADYLTLADSVHEHELRLIQDQARVHTTGTVAALSRDVGRLQSHNHALQEQVRSLQELKLQLQSELQALRNPHGGSIEAMPPASAPTAPASAVPPQAMAVANTPSVTAPPAMVDIIVPVYRGLSDTRRCLESVLTSAQRQAWRLVVINDCSPEPEVTLWLRELAAREPRVLLLENELNLGFVATVNRGMALSDSHDVVLLNSDTEVANDWLDRLTQAAHGHGRVGTVTPFSNNATICSYPRFCTANSLPQGHNTRSLDTLFAQANPGQVVDVPTGVGFCMYIRRDCLQEVGLFDVESFGKGYGEENDFCRRAHARGWRNLHALDTFVLHAGGVSFGETKSARELAAMQTLKRLHPDYELAVHEFIRQDPAQAARLTVDFLRVQADPRPQVLLVSHDRGGGTHRHTVELAEHLRAHAGFHLLQTAENDRVKLTIDHPSGASTLWFRLPGQTAALHQVLRSLGVAHVHFHHLLGHRPEVWQLPEALGLAFDFTAHDYYSKCPQISLTDASHQYCGELGLSQCHDCLRQTPAPGNPTIDIWHLYHRDMVTRARYVLAPSLDTARRMLRFAPQANVCLAPHTDLQHPHGLLVPAPRARDQGQPLRVVVLGALSAIKGADLLEAVALAAAQSNLALEFHLVGYAYRPLKTQPRARLTVHGPYEEQELGSLLTWLQPDVAWFPARWPETYSYTLSACLDLGLPVVAPALGAFTERLTGREWTWLLPWQTDANDLARFFDSIRVGHFNTLQPPSPACSDEPPHAIDGQIRSWDYDRDYLVNLAAPRALPPADVGQWVRLTHPEAIAPAPVEEVRHGQDAASSRVAEGSVEAELAMPPASARPERLARVQALPGVNWLAHRVPGRLRRLVKRWVS